MIKKEIKAVGFTILMFAASAHANTSPVQPETALHAAFAKYVGKLGQSAGESWVREVLLQCKTDSEIKAFLDGMSGTTAPATAMDSLLDNYLAQSVELHKEFPLLQSWQIDEIVSPYQLNTVDGLDSALDRLDEAYVSEFLKNYVQHEQKYNSEWVSGVDTFLRNLVDSLRSQVFTGVISYKDFDNQHLMNTVNLANSKSVYVKKGDLSTRYGSVKVGSHFSGVTGVTALGVNLQEIPTKLCIGLVENKQPYIIEARVNGVRVTSPESLNALCSSKSNNVMLVVK